MITFDGITSDQMHLVVEHRPKIILPRRRQEVITVPGRNGDIILDSGSFENYEQSYQVFLDPNYGGSNRGHSIDYYIPDIADWLFSRPGYHELRDSYRDSCYRVAQFSGTAEILDLLNEYGEATLSFLCAPERWLDSGQSYINVGNGITLSNPTKFKAPPLIKIVGDSTNGDGYFSVCGYSGKITSMSPNKTIYIDAKTHMAKSTTVSAVSSYSRFRLVEWFQSGGNSVSSFLFNSSGGSFEYEKLYIPARGSTGNMSVSFSGGISRMEIMPCWWTL